MLPDRLDEGLLKLAGCCQEDDVLFLPGLYISHCFLCIQTSNYAIVWSAINNSERSMILQGDKLLYLTNSQFSLKVLIYCSLGNWAGFSTCSYFLPLSCKKEVITLELDILNILLLFLVTLSMFSRKFSLGGLLALTPLGDKRASASSLSTIISGKWQLHC